MTDKVISSQGEIHGEQKGWMVPQRRVRKGPQDRSMKRVIMGCVSEKATVDLKLGKKKRVK